jgi:hypothetical protein
MIAQAGGLTYTFPARQIGEQQPVAGGQAPMQAQQGGSPFDIPLVEDGVPTIENYTRNYYDSYGRLKDFTETMWKDYGVDVTKPDFSQPGGGLLHEAFQKMDADLRIAANDLSESKNILAEQRKAELEMKAMKAPGYDPYAQIAREAPNGMIPLGLFEDVQQGIQGVSNKVYNTPGEVQRAYATLQPLIQKYETLKTTDPRNAAVYQRQIDALRQPTYSTPDVAWRPPSGGGSEKDQQYLTMARKIANSMAGNWTPDDTEYDPQTKQNISILNAESGLSMGQTTVKNQKGEDVKVDKIIKRYVKTPDGEVYAEFNDDRIPRERVDNKSADEAVTTIFNENKLLGGDDAIEFLNRLRQTSGGGYTLRSLYAPEQESLYQEAKSTGMTSTAATKQGLQRLAEVKSNISSRFKTNTEAVNTAAKVFSKSLPVGSRAVESLAKLFISNEISIKDLFKDYPEVSNMAPDINISISGDKFNLTKSDYAKLKGVSTTDVVSSQYTDLTEDEILNILSTYVSKAMKGQAGIVPATQTTTGATGNDINQRIQGY